MAACASPAAWVSLPVNQIMVGPRLRAVDEVAASNLAVAISETDFHGSILVRPVPSEEGEGSYQLVVGAHRLAAVRALGWTAIPATIRVLTDDEALQIEIDENLIRKDLTPLERAETVQVRLEVWARRFPEKVVPKGDAAAPKRGRPSNSVKLTEFLGGASPAMGFTEESANVLGFSDSTVKRALQIVQGIPADLRRQLRSTPIAKNEGALRQLAAIGDKAEQARTAAALIEGRAKSVSDAISVAAGKAPSRAVQTPVDQTLKGFRKVWNDATPSGRAAIMHELHGLKLPKGYVVTTKAAADA